MSDKDFISVGKCLKKERLKLKITQEKLAKLLNVSIATVKKIENENHLPKDETFIKLYDLFPNIKKDLKDSCFQKKFLKQEKSNRNIDYQYFITNFQKTDACGVNEVIETFLNKLIISFESKIKETSNVIENRLTNETLKKESLDFSTAYFNSRKNNSFDSNLESRTLLITKIWDFNKLVSQQWADIKLLFELCDPSDFLKMEKGIYNILDTLNNISNDIEKTVNLKKTKKNTIITLEKKEDYFE